MGTFLKLHKIIQKDVKLALQNYTNENNILCSKSSAKVHHFVTM